MRLRPIIYFHDINAQRSLTMNSELKAYPGKNDVEKIKFSGFLAQEVENAAKESGYDFKGVRILETNINNIPSVMKRLLCL